MVDGRNSPPLYSRLLMLVSSPYLPPEYLPLLQPPGPSRITRPGMNPFSHNPNGLKTRSNNNVGNPTARQTIASGNREDQGRPAKRTKLDHTFIQQPALSKTHIRKANIGEFSGEFTGSQLIIISRTTETPPLGSRTRRRR